MAYSTINDPSAQFQAQLYTGNGSNSHDITNTGNANLQPDLIWIKDRSASTNPNIQDTTRGINKQLFTDGTPAQYTDAAWGHVNSVASDGFQVDVGNSASEANTNKNSNTYVAWQWKANAGNEVANNDGNATSYVQVNSTAGMSIIRFTGGGSTAYNLGHGLTKTPSFFLAKNYSSTSGWYGMFPKFWGGNQSSGLNTTDAFGTVSGFTGFTTSVFQEGQNDTDNYIAYAWIPIKGYSAFGTYKCNNNADGPKIFTGFKPAFVILKMNSAGTNWRMYDSKREGFNPENNFLLANSQGAENTDANSEIEFHSNGFKCVQAEGDINYNTERVLYAAWADKPSCFSDGVPTTAF
tara:strand:+ start:2187 stop:3239 length:1053 start_codon:yes stop_codon:yes gene_type:complete